MHRWLALALAAALVGCGREPAAPGDPAPAGGKLVAWGGEATLQPLREALGQMPAQPPANLAAAPDAPAGGPPAAVDAPAEAIEKSPEAPESKGEPQPAAGDAPTIRRGPTGAVSAIEPPQNFAASGPVAKADAAPKAEATAPRSNPAERRAERPAAQRANSAAANQTRRPEPARGDNTRDNQPQRIVLTAQLIGHSKVPEPGTVPYTDCLTTLKVKVVQVLEGRYDRPEMLVVTEGMKNNKLETAANPPPLRLTFRLTVEPLSAHPDKQRMMTADDFTSDPSPRYLIRQFKLGG